MRIAFAGNPNSGKTTMYNALTGSSERVGNWAGVTVDKKEARIKKTYAGRQNITAVDLPGAYSMSPFTSEESVTNEYVRNENPDVIINIVDASNLGRSLFFTTQLLELGIPLVVALNKADINEKQQTTIDRTLLSEKLGCPVIDTVSTRAKGLAEVIRAAIELKGTVQKAPYRQEAAHLSDKQAAEEEDRKRFAFVNDIVAQVEVRKVFTKDKTVQDKFDAILTNPIIGLLIFAAMMFLVFNISQAWLGPWVADALGVLLEGFQGKVQELLTGASPLLQTLLVDGIIGGMIAVIEFLPLVMVMYFLISLLEDCGYMARATVVLDPIFKKVGLSGKSVIPFVVGTGCAVPGIMACRTIRDERERRAAAMLTPFMPCGAKLPVISLFAGAFFENTPWVGTLMYFAGILIILIGAVLIHKITGYNARKAFFIIELPAYKLPSVKRAFQEMCARGWSYVVKAATIILLCNTAVHLMQTFTWDLSIAETAGESILAYVAKPFGYALMPIIGVFSWQMAAAAVAGFIAKENVVGTLAVCFVGLDNLINAEEMTMLSGAGAEVVNVFAITKAAALAYLMFNLFSPPCFAAIGAMNSEMQDRKWFWGGIGLQLGTGYTIGYLVYTIGTLLADPASLNISAAIGGGVAVLAFGLVLIVLTKRAKQKAAMKG
ncbi:MAG: ferrous iron transporter B [Clostridia bacterium]|nr:ferrous iron transporter B [Clostridia bacterium]